MAKTRTEPMVVDGDVSVEEILGSEEPEEARNLYGRITISFWDHGSVGGAQNIVPEVSFDPVGRINPNTIERFLPAIYNEILRAQAVARGPRPQTGPRIELLSNEISASGASR